MTYTSNSPTSRGWNALLILTPVPRWAEKQAGRGGYGWSTPRHTFHYPSHNRKSWKSGNLARFHFISANLEDFQKISKIPRGNLLLDRSLTLTTLVNTCR
jgi:hypothetical protein